MKIHDNNILVLNQSTQLDGHQGIVGFDTFGSKSKQEAKEFHKYLIANSSVTFYETLYSLMLEEIQELNEIKQQGEKK